MRKLIFFVAAIALQFALHAVAALPEKLRVLTVDLENGLIQTPGLPGGELAQDLRTLLEKADPDIICLQGVTDWESCERICKLKPGLRVLTCSAFPTKTDNAAAPQVAILARDRAVISWVEEIGDGSGFALAVLQAGSHKVGVFSLQTPKASAAGSVSATERLLAEISKLQKFPQNRPEAFLIAGGPLSKSSSVIDAGLQTIPPDPQAAPSSRSEFWVADAGFIARPRAIAMTGLRSPALVCDFDSDSTFSSKFAYQTPLLFAGETPAAVQPVLSAVAAPAAANELRSLALPVGITAGFFLLAFLVLRRSNRPAQMQLVPLNGPDGVVPSNQLQQEAIRSNLLSWIKSLFVQRLLSQRQQLLSNETEATQRTLLIEEKLSHLQTTLQLRISAYESRIERLEHELTAATVENRDLIRSQIDLLKEKVAKAKEERAVCRN
jgi:hypothetical protein